MNVVMFHSGKELPTFLEDNFKQFRLFNPDVLVYFLTDYHHLHNPIFEKYGVISINKDEFYSEKIVRFEQLFGRDSDDFWTLAATRLIYIENFMRIRSMVNVYHFENDVLVYYPLKQYHTIFRKFSGIGMTVGGPDKCMTGFSFIKSYKILCHMTDYFINLLNDYGIVGIKQKFHVDMVNEMTLMRIYLSDADTKMWMLPSMPFPPMDYNFPLFNSIFDPASWGQFVGGTQGEGPGAKPKDHYIGVMLQSNPTYIVKWLEGIPYFAYNGKMVKINNLHIHSKNLNLYTSDGLVTR